MYNKFILYTVIFLSCLFLYGCNDRSLNNPHPLADYGKNIRFSSFAVTPKTLDPAQSYSTDETVFIAQIYEPPLQYHYLKRPYSLVPLTAKTTPLVRYWDKSGNLLPDNAYPTQVAYTTYDIQIQPGIFYQPHPAFAKDRNGRYLYQRLTLSQLKKINTLADFTQTGTRELVAADYIYQIKRLAHPGLNSPILGLMQKHILGMTEYTQQLRKAYDQQKNTTNNFFDLRKYPLAGATVIDKYTYRITLTGEYRQFNYWLAMPFFSPIPWEADAFYSQPGLKENNISFDWYPVGTGPYSLAENNPNKQMVLTRNPNFHKEYYPTEGSATDQAAGYLDDAGKRLPFVDTYIFSLEKESIPRWNKFLQGYYDQSAISPDNFGEAIKIDMQGKPELTPELSRKAILLRTSIDPEIYYYGFNMLDKTVGGYSERAQKLRQAIAIALDIEEFINVFMNGRGVAAQGPIPQGIFGYISGVPGINPYVYDIINNTPQRKSLAVAKQLLAEAGYPNGRDIKTGKPLVLHYNTGSISLVDSDQFNWMRKQFAKLGIDLIVETSDLNRFQDKLRSGNVQIFPYGWVADYPDPENFLFLLYGPNSSVKTGGMNAVNYQNPAFDRLFEQMKSLPNTAERQAIIQQMVNIVRKDSPWIWGENPKNFILAQQWLTPVKPNAFANNFLKYQHVAPELRLKLITEWNKPILWPLALLLLIIFFLALPVCISYWLRIHRPAKRSKHF